MDILTEKEQFQEALVSWYESVKRDLPWRKTSNPYYIWVSEVMLQQTRVDTVIPYYERFIEKYPTIEQLAQSDEEQLLKMWEGLGYYSRARNLKAGAQQVLDHFNGVIPQTRKEISTLKGIGPYTAGAILSIAFGIPEHAVDGNVMRVLSRIVMIEDDIAIPKTKKIFEQVVMDLIDHENPSAFNQGLMELGATICTPNPSCLLCPVQSYCSAFHEGRELELPVKSKKKKSKEIPVASFALRNEKGQWLLKQRPEKGLLANLWEFPMIELTTTESAMDLLKKQEGIEIETPVKIVDFKHIFTHITWHVSSYMSDITTVPSLNDRIAFFTDEEVERLPKPVPVIKVWEQLKKQYGITIYDERTDEKNSNT
ncbi:MAG TPA: A/G-specific adenine glycosylase [Sporosarcina sp.]|nr:A/G-specific adenine glycosylase [Sporosarcina sp.]